VEPKLVVIIDPDLKRQHLLLLLDVKLRLVFIIFIAYLLILR
jgi:hypothetical protein